MPSKWLSWEFLAQYRVNLKNSRVEAQLTVHVTSLTCAECHRVCVREIAVLMYFFSQGTSECGIQGKI